MNSRDLLTKDRKAPRTRNLSQEQRTQLDAGAKGESNGIINSAERRQENKEKNEERERKVSAGPPFSTRVEPVASVKYFHLQQIK